MIKDYLKSLQRDWRCTFLGVGPMSVNCVDATIELANDFDIPIFLIASRRQVDSTDFGGGYVNNWNTRDFSKYVTKKDFKKKILMSRDHGGPWQNNKEKDLNFTLEEAIKSAKRSFSEDIDCGFKILHIDPSIEPNSIPTTDQVLDRLFELYEHCWAEASKKNKEVIFEVGTEEQSGSTNTQEELNYSLNEIYKFCRRNKIPYPNFVVVQCGTRVMEMRNVGSLDSPVRVANEIPAEIQVPKMIEICNRYDILMKEHNTDYLSDEALQWHPRFGIHAANVAPEFGVAETKALLNVLNSNNLTYLSDRFLEISYESRKWKKWMLKDSCASEEEKAIIAGHYVFSSPEVSQIKLEASQELSKIGIDLKNHLKDAVKVSILRYLNLFRLIRP